MKEPGQRTASGRSSFLGSIRGNIISYVALCTVIIILVTSTLNSVVMQNVLLANGQTALTEKAENTGELIDPVTGKTAEMDYSMDEGDDLPDPAGGGAPVEPAQE